MTPEQTAKRKRIMQRSIALGHCVCDPQKPCPCPLFKEKNVCECAGERLPVSSGPVRLTDHVRAAGCASKIGKKDLKEILSGLPDIADERVIVGRSAGDDAGVIMLTPDTASVLTVDVFAPSVDDPYTFGQIAAANSLSDIYAMGADAQAALSIIGFPIHTLPGDVMHQILRGGIDKMTEAGVSVVGGHSINDEEVKCGFAVLGTTPARSFKQNSGAKAGDVMILTKPLGNGIVAFAAQIGRTTKTDLDEISTSMTMLNKTAGELMQKYNASAATDITGFSLLGHLAEIIRNSKIEVTIDFDSLPLFSRVLEYAAGDVFPGAVERNRESVPPELLDFNNLPEKLQNVLFGPETSGGLLVFLPQDAADNYLKDIRASGNEYACIIGQVSGANAQGLIRVRGAESIDLAAIAGEANQKSIKISSCCDSQASEKVNAPAKAPTPAACCCNSAPEKSESKSTSTDSCCSERNIENTSTKLPQPSAMQEFSGWSKEVNNSGAIDLKNKKLMSLALSVSHKCRECVMLNLEAARKAGAGETEISEAVAMGIFFGGASSNMFYQSLQQG